MAERITIVIETGNAAFEDYPMGEVARILHDLAERMESRDEPHALRDANGNRCGTVSVEDL